MNDSIGDHTGFAAACTGQNKQRSVNGFHRFALLRVELVKEIDHVRSSIACLGFYRKGGEGGKTKSHTEARRKLNH
jgi:hypothetical protein